jgi:4-alpha-glucanotransferase
MNKRGSGILMHITSLPSPYGIGTLGRAAYDFVDFLHAARQSYWQILPIGPTGFAESPYQSLSSFGGNPYFIDLDILSQEGLLSSEDYKYLDFGRDRERVDYPRIFENRYRVFKKAYLKGRTIYSEEIEKFKEENSWWIEDYALYMALKFKNDLKPWDQWQEDIKLRREPAIEKCREALKDEIEYWVFLQYIFFTQWKCLKSYANSKGIQIIGDLPIYVAQDSVDTWSNSELFLLDGNKNPIKVAGCPPDYFSKHGQLWGNPIYHWEEHEKQNFKWWIKRIKKNMENFDIIRLDHFRGIESYWEVPYGNETAEEGQWMKGPGMKLIKAIEESLGKVNIIAEDLGILTPEVMKLKEEAGYPGMKVLQFAFQAGEESIYLPHNIDRNSVVYTGTHDNNTIMGWFEDSSHRDINFAIEYLKLNKVEGYNWGMIRGAWSSVSNTSIAPMQDFLGLGSHSRMNTPSTIGGNWCWRVKEEELSTALAERIRKLTILYGR